MKKINNRPNVHVVAAAEFVCWFLQTYMQTNYCAITQSHFKLCHCGIIAVASPF